MRSDIRQVNEVETKKGKPVQFKDVIRANLHRTDQWQSLLGEMVEVWLDGKLYRRGLVDATMPNASGLWIAPEGAFQRQFIDASDGYEVWTTFYPRSGGAGSVPAEVESRENTASRTLGCPTLPPSTVDPNIEEGPAKFSCPANPGLGVGVRA